MPNLLRFVKENRLILIAATFFVVWKFFLIGTLWDDRQIPPVPDDSYIYILHIDSTLRCPNLFSCDDRAFSFDTYASFDHLTYRLFLGTIGKILGLDAETTYHLGFYLGTVLLVPALLIFLKLLNGKDQRLTAFSIVILAFYNGAGSYHGFFWVVPSFFVLLFFLIILRVLLDDTYKHWKVSLAIIAPFYVFTHVLSLYFLTIPPMFFAIHWFLTKTPNTLLLRKTAFLYALVFIIYAPVAFHYSVSSYGNPYGPETIVKNIVNKQPVASQNLEQKSISPSGQKKIATIFPGIGKIQADYFHWIFPSWFGYPVFLLCIGILASTKRFTLLSLYLAGLLFSLLSSTNAHGERSLIFLWPLTFLLYGQAGWFGIHLIGKQLKKTPLAIFLKTILITIILFFGILAATFAYLWNTYLNQARKTEAPQAVAEYLIRNTLAGEKVAYSRDMNFLDEYLLLVHGSNGPERTTDIPKAKYYVAPEKWLMQSDTKFYESTFKNFFGIISKTLLFSKEKNEKNNDGDIIPESVILTEEARISGVMIHHIAPKTDRP